MKSKSICFMIYTLRSAIFEIKFALDMFILKTKKV